MYSDRGGKNMRRGGSDSPPFNSYRNRSISPSPNRPSRVPPVRITRQSPSPPLLMSRRRSASSSSRPESRYNNQKNYLKSTQRDSPISSSSGSPSPLNIERPKLNNSPTLASSRSFSSQPNRLNKANNNNNNTISNFTIESVKSSTDLPIQKSPYNKVAQSMRRIVPQEMACSMGCGGAKCKYDNSNWPEQDMAIKGLFSHW
jgi:hypothetical protein